MKSGPGRWSLIRENFVNSAGVVGEVESPGRILTEGRDLVRSVKELLRLPLLVDFFETPEAARAVVGIEIGPLERRELGATVDIAAGDGTIATGVVILDDRRD